VRVSNKVEGQGSNGVGGRYSNAVDGRSVFAESVERRPSMEMVTKELEQVSWLEFRVIRSVEAIEPVLELHREHNAGGVDE